MIYFITSRELNRVKIGYTRNNLQQRFHTIQAHSPVALELEFCCEGSKAEEFAIHERFAASRERGEWFNISHELDDFMRAQERYVWRHRGCQWKRPEQDKAA